MLVELIIGLIILIISYIQWTGTYWYRLKIDSKSPKFIFGNLTEYILRKKHFAEIYHEIYTVKLDTPILSFIEVFSNWTPELLIVSKYESEINSICKYPDAAYIGAYKLLNKPAIIVRDLDLIKDILSKNFNSFINNDYTLDEKLDPLLSKNPFMAKDSDWKLARNHLAPMLTATRIKSYFPIINNICKQFPSYLQDTILNGEFDAKRVFASYTLEVMAAVTLSIEAETFKTNNSKFQIMTDKIFNPNTRDSMKTIMACFLPQLSTILRKPIIEPEIDQWWRSIISDMIEQRKTDVERKIDIFQNLYELRNKVDLSLDRISGYALSMLFEGFETSSSLLAYCLLELAQHPEKMQRAQQEIDYILEKYNGVWCDEATQEMHYMDAVLNETLRLWPPLLIMQKVLNRKYQLPPQYKNSDYTPIIEPGTVFFISLYSIHRDENHYQNPNIFDPERFMNENKSKINKYAFLPFGGEGPRQCIGTRFALAQSKAGIGTILSNYNIKLSSKTKLPLKLSINTFLLSTEEGIWFEAEKRT